MKVLYMHGVHTVHAGYLVAAPRAVELTRNMGSAQLPSHALIWQLRTRGDPHDALTAEAATWGKYKPHVANLRDGESCGTIHRDPQTASFCIGPVQSAKVLVRALGQES